MSPVLRIALAAGAVMVVVITIAGIRRSRMRIEDSMFWVALSALLLILAVFPQVGYAASEALGFMAPVNFVFAFFIAALTVKCFTLTRRCSELSEKVKELAQQVAVDRLDHYERSHDSQRGRSDVRGDDVR